MQMMLLCKKLIGSFLVLILVSINALAQIPNLSGLWSGTSNTPLGVYQVFDQIEQQGLTLSGRGCSINLKKTDSAAYEFEGYVAEGKIQLTLTKFTYKSGLACLSKSKLEYKKEGEQEFLIGRWGANMVKGGCLPGISGAIRLMKVKKENTNGVLAIASSQVSINEKIAREDAIGNSMIERLKSTNYYALIIGAEDYNGDDIAKLDNPVSDAENVKKTLNENYYFNDQTTILLKNPTRDEIIKNFEALTKIVTPKDQLLIFYAGHGVWDEKLTQGYWLPIDANLYSKANWLSNSTIRDYLRGIKSGHTLLITDACFSGGILKERAVFQNSKAMLELYKLPSRKAITSGTLTTVPDKSVFIQYLVKKLEDNTAPLLSASELFNAFKIAVINNSPNGQVPQLGVINQTGDEGGEFIFLKREQ